MSVDQTYESLRLAMIGDQFLSSLTPDVRMFVRERKPSDPMRMAELADNYASARNSYPKSKAKSAPSDKQNETVNSPDRNVKCYSCGLNGHKRNNCPQRGPSPRVQRAFNAPDPEGPMVDGSSNGIRLSSILRDTGCTCVIASSWLFPNLDTSELPNRVIYDYLGRANSFPVLKCYLKCELYTGWVDTVIAPLKFCAVLLGNIPGVKMPDMTRGDPVAGYSSKECPKNNSSSSLENNCLPVTQAVTRSQLHRVTKEIPLPKISDLEISPTDFQNFQESCESLKLC